MLEALKNFDANRLDMEELVVLSAFGRSLETETSNLGMESPKWLEPRLRELRREIRTRTEDQIEKQIVENTANIERLKPAEEKRGALTQANEQLKAKLLALRQGN